MIRKLKTLSAALFAALVIGALLAGTAQATGESELTPGGIGPETILKGEQTTTHNFAVGSREFTCNVSKVEGSIAGNTTEATVTPTYEGCMTKPVLGVSFQATVTMNGCDYLYTGTPTEPAGTYKASMQIKCPEGKRIEIDVYKVGTAHEPANHICTLTIEPQTVGGAVTIANGAGRPDDITLTANQTLKTTIHGIVCGETAPAGSDTSMEFTGTLTGTTTVRAYDTAETQRDLTVSHG